MLELSSARKHRINLSDYDSEQDIQNRMLMADSSSFDLEVLEEILFSPLKISLKKLARGLDCEEEVLLPILNKFSGTGLLMIQEDCVLVDKEKRKYFEFQISRFQPEFKPDMEFVQGILRKVPIHILPSWYSIPRTSNNIFESIVEKHLATPQIYQRYLQEFHCADPTIQGLVEDLFSSPNLQISSSDLIAKYNLSRHRFEEILLFLEFHFICCLAYEKEEDHWVEFVTPFQEWKEYLSFLRKTEAPWIDAKRVLRKEASDFAFIEKMSEALDKAPLKVSALDSHAVEKLCLVKLADLDEGSLRPLEAAMEWLQMTLENRALFLYRHPLNRILSSPHSSERAIREAEKSIKRVLHGQWILFEDFFKGVLVSLHEDATIQLKRTGKHWKYTLPTYSEEDKAFIKATIFEWLFEMGMVAIGTCQGEDCFCVTSFGRCFFED